MEDHREGPGSPEEGEAPQDEAVATLLSGLRKLAGFDGITYRGAPTDAAFGREGQVLVSTGLVATSRDPRVATENFSSAGLYAVVGNAGRAIEAYSQHLDEREVVFLPSTMFLVVKRARVGDLPVTIVEQLDPDRDPDERGASSIEETARVVVAQVAAAREREPVVVHAAGKFCGEIT